ncbi:MAG: hypothetical protein WC851_05655 [Candidatus Shapirobacteria bacterium]|jgi:CO dehydrogenase/acetyl-CoA synthase beta subunit
MADDSILKKVLKNLGQIGMETGKEIAKEGGKITESVITGKELLGGLKTLTPEETARKRAEDEQKKQAEMANLRAGMSESGRNVQAEMTQVEKEEEREEDQKEKQFLENLRIQRQMEAQEHQQLAAEMGVSTNPAKQKKSRGSAFAKGKKKTQQPDPSQLSQTAELAGKME